MDDLIKIAKRHIKRYIRGETEDFIAFCGECVNITGGDEDYGTATVPFKFWQAQRELAKGIIDNDQIILLKPRQMGATWLILAYFLYRVLFWDGVEYRITSVGEKEAAKALKRVKFMIDHLPPWLDAHLDIDNTTTIQISETKSIITALPSTENAGRGDTLDGLLVDEDAFQVYSAQIVKSALPALEKRHGKLFRISTANGVGNNFQRTFVESQQGKTGYKAVFFPWTADPKRDQKWYDRLLQKEGPEYMHENYPSNPQEAFLASGRPFFSQERIVADLSKEDVPFHDGYLDKKEFCRMSRGMLRVWEEPAPGKKYVVFADVSEGLEKGDWSVAYVVPVGGGPEVARLRGKPDPAELGDLLIQLGEWYSFKEDGNKEPALVAVEANNHGIATCKKMEEAGYRNLFRERDLKTGDFKDRIGWLTTQTTRRIMLGRMQGDYRTGECAVRDRTCLEEMSLFAYRGSTGKAQAPPDGNDDCVMARSGAHYLATLETMPDDKEPWIDSDEAQALGFRRTDAFFWVQKGIEKMNKRGKDESVDYVNAWLEEI